MLIAGTWSILSDPDPLWSDIYSSPFLCSDQLIVEMLLPPSKSLTLHSVFHYSLFMHFFLSLYYWILFSPFLKTLKTSGLIWILWSILNLNFPLNTCLLLIGCMPFQFSNWLLADCMENVKIRSYLFDPSKYLPCWLQKWFTS